MKKPKGLKPSISRLLRFFRTRIGGGRKLLDKLPFISRLNKRTEPEKQLRALAKLLKRTSKRLKKTLRRLHGKSKRELLKIIQDTERIRSKALAAVRDIRRGDEIGELPGRLVREYDAVKRRISRMDKQS